MKYPQNIFNISLTMTIFCNRRKNWYRTLSQNWLTTEITRIFIFLAIWKNNQQNKFRHSTALPSLKPTLFTSTTLRAFGKLSGKLISRKLVLRDTTQLKGRYLYKANELALESRVNLEIQENAISNHHRQKKPQQTK